MLNDGFSEKIETNKDILSFLNTNERSLGPKTESLIDNLKELECQIAVVTETWLNYSSQEELLQDLLDGAGYGARTLNRTSNNRGISHGGVAVLYRSSRANAKPFPLHNPKKYEILPCPRVYVQNKPPNTSPLL